MSFWVRHRCWGALGAAWALAVLGAGERSAGGERWFLGAEPVSLSAGAGAMVVKSLDRDLRPDLVVAHPARSFVSVLLAEGGGRFSEGKEVEVDPGPSAICAADLRGAGVPDLVVLSEVADSGVVLWNRGDGTFERGPRLSVGREPCGCVGAVLGAGGPSAIVVWSRDPSEPIRAWVEDGAGGFGEPLSLKLGGSVLAAAPSGLPEGGVWTLSRLGERTVSVARVRRGAGGALEAVPLLLKEVPSVPIAAALRVSSSGELEGAAVLLEDGALIWLLRAGEGFEAVSVAPPDPELDVLAEVYLEDLDSDGFLDLASKVEWRGASWLRVARGLEAGGFSAVRLLELGASGVASVGFADFDLDGRVDAVAARSGARILLVARGRGGGEFSVGRMVSVDSGLADVVLGDFDGDGAADVLARFGYRLFFLPGDGAGGFGEAVVSDLPRIMDLQRDSYLSYGRMAAVDYDGDGVTDVAFPMRGSPPFEFAASEVVVAFLDRAMQVADSGRFQLLAARPIALAGGDFNRDGYGDVAVAVGEGPQAMLLFGSWTRFGAISSIDVGSPQSAVAFRDLGDAGGQVLAAAVPDSVVLFLGDGRGWFLPGPRIGAVGGATWLHIGEVEADGAPGLVAAVGDRVVVVRGILGAEPVISASLEVSANFRAVDAQDVDADGLLDVAVVAGRPPILVLFRGQGGGEFAPAEAYFAGSDPRDIDLADVDGDGLVDALIVQGDGTGLLVLRGLGNGAGSMFIRGDVDLDGRVSLTDAVRILGSLFLGAGDLPCEDAADTNDDGALSITDAIYLLGHLFLGGEEPPAPYPEPGIDPTEDALGC